MSLMIAALSALLTALAALVTLYPSGDTLSMGARALDSFSPYFLLMALVLALATLAMGRGRAGAIMSGAALVGLVLHGASYWRTTAPVDPSITSDLRVIFFNARWDNTANADRIVTEALAAEPDIVIFAEPQGLLPLRDRFEAGYQILDTCKDDWCDYLIASRLPTRGLVIGPLDPWSERLAVFEAKTSPDTWTRVIVSHISKPWDVTLIEPAIDELIVYYTNYDGPTVAVGDFNSAPWSNHVRRLLTTTGFRGVRGQFGTWPIRLGGFGLPIDQLLTGPGTATTRVQPFGDGLGSNHRGVLADIAILP